MKQLYNKYNTNKRQTIKRIRVKEEEALQKSQDFQIKKEK